MATFITVLLVIHIIGGFGALISGFIASVTRKGNGRHRGSGQAYFWSMTAVFITAVVLGVLKQNWFLFMVGFFSYYLVVRGYRILYLKQLGRGQKASVIDWAVATTGGIFGLALIGSSLRLLPNSFAPVPLVFGLICVGFAAKDVQLFIKGPKEKGHWIFGHIAGMGGGYIATWTAFLVTNITFLPPVMVWLAPTVIGSVCIGYTIFIWKKKLAPRKPAAVATSLHSVL